MKQPPHLLILFFALLGAGTGVAVTMIDRRFVLAHPVASESVGLFPILLNAIVVLPTGLLHEWFVGDSRYHPMSFETSFMAASVFNAFVGVLAGAGFCVALRDILRRR